MNANNEITLEVCGNLEALREFCGLDFAFKVAYGEENDAAERVYEEIVDRLERLGYRTEQAKGQRSLCHGWNGANTFRHKLGAVGTFGDLTAEQQEEIYAAQSAADEAVISSFFEAE